MSPIVDQKALEDFIDHADLDEARRAEAALVAMAASVRMRVVELETRFFPGRTGPASALSAFLSEPISWGGL